MTYQTPQFLTFLIFCAIVFSASSECPAHTLPIGKATPVATAPKANFVSGPACRPVINEIMADPTPPVGLPDFEWIELYNPDECTVNLTGWRLTVGSVTRVLPEIYLNPGEFIILCSSSASPALQKWGRTVVISLPALRNSGNRIVLSSADGDIADAVNYSDSWYGDNRKKDGGWTLERVDPLRSCGESGNWLASNHPDGGTPGKVNSVNAENTDHTAPEILVVKALSLNSALIIFNEPMDTLSMGIALNYRLSKGYGIPDSVILQDETTVELKWENKFQVNLTYSLEIQNVYDACGNPPLKSNFLIQWVELEPGDLVINEVLFNPFPGGVDFVEIFNRSGKRIEPAKLVLAARDENLLLRQEVSLKSIEPVIEPGGYMAVSVNRETIMQFYAALCPDCLHNLPSLPAMNNDEGSIVLMDDRQIIVDEFNYSEKMHHRLLHNFKGISLERVNPEVSANDRHNWQSAAADAGFATPGYENSQFSPDSPGKARIAVSPEAISPNGDGYNDILEIRYETPSPGWVANSRVFDLSGNLRANLLRNELIATSGKIFWDGRDENGRMLPSGPYVMMIEMFDLDGHIERFRRAFFLVGP
jgi:hypothetical protein